jgi:hypothetical protein
MGDAGASMTLGPSSATGAVDRWSKKGMSSPSSMGTGSTRTWFSRPRSRHCWAMLGLPTSTHPAVALGLPRPCQGSAPGRRETAGPAGRCSRRPRTAPASPSAPARRPRCAVRRPRPGARPRRGSGTRRRPARLGRRDARTSASSATWSTSCLADHCRSSKGSLQRRGRCSRAAGHPWRREAPSGGFGAFEVTIGFRYRHIDPSPGRAGFHAARRASPAGAVPVPGHAAPLRSDPLRARRSRGPPAPSRRPFEKRQCRLEISIRETGVDVHQRSPPAPEAGGIKPSCVMNSS